MSSLALKLKSALCGAREYSDKHPRLSYFCLAALCSLVPLFISMFLHAMQNTGVSIFRSIPQNIDELYYYTQIKAMVEYGAPLGYVGAGGTHAAVGTFGFWGVATLLPYALFGWVFGWGYYSMAIANILMFTLAHLLFVYLARPTVRQMGLLSIANLISFFVQFYFYSSMTMPLRYACAILFAGIFIRLYRFETPKWFRFIAVPLFVIFSAMSFYPYLIFIPPLVVAAAKTKKQFVKRALASVALTVACAAPVIYLNNLVSAPYVLGEDELVVFIREMLAHPLAALPLAFRRLMKKAALVDPFSMLFIDRAHWPELNAFRMFFLCAYALCIILCVYFVFREKREKNKDSFVYTLFALWATLTFWVGFLLADSKGENLNNFLREFCLAYLAAVFILAFCYRGRLLKLLALFSILGVVPFWTSLYYPYYGLSRYATEADIDYYNLRAETYAQHIVLDPESDNPWDNTIVVDTRAINPMLWAPSGLGYNSYRGMAKYALNGEREPCEARYVLACFVPDCAACHMEDTGQSVSDLYIELGYELLYTDTDTGNAIFRRPD